MADFEEALHALLADPAAMGQIMTLAQSLGAAHTAEDTTDLPPETGEPGQTEDSPEAVDTPNSRHSDFGDLGNLDNLGDLGDLGKFTRLMGLFQQGNTLDPEAIALLNALRPFLRPERQRKLDRAIRLATLSQTLRTAYTLWKEGDLPV